MSITLSEEEMRYISLLEMVSGVKARDCIFSEEENRLIFLVEKELVGLCVGKNGRHIKKLRRLLGKEVEVVGYSEDPEEFLRLLFAPVQLSSLTLTEEDGKKVAVVEVRPQEKGLAIGKAGARIKRAKKLAQRNLGIHNIIIR
ncbi:MAG: NusA-like transcription termination signal-binding factor [Hadesarchaea archaeon]|nr:MAG: NusA-like transcription termination signal-binding factor [Hadesarchaea archaeon]